MSDNDAVRDQALRDELDRQDREQAAGAAGTTENPLRGSRTSGFYAGVIGLGIVLILLIIFIAQNTRKTTVSFLAWDGQVPVAVAILIAAVAGLFLAGTAGSLRIMQLRRAAYRTTTAESHRPGAYRSAASSASRLMRGQPGVPGRADPLQLAGDVAEPPTERAVHQLAALRCSDSTSPAAAQHLEVLDDRLPADRELAGQGRRRRRAPRPAGPGSPSGCRRPARRTRG